MAALARDQVEHQFLRRIQALEAKVSDRDGLLEKLSRQQARLDRLECLAEENEMLRAQLRDRDLRAAKDTRARQCRTPQASGSCASGNVKGEGALTPRDSAPVRRVSPPPCTDAAESTGEGLLFLESLEFGKSDSASWHSVLKQSSPKATPPHGFCSSELENRLDELETALGLKPGYSYSPEPPQGAGG